MTKDDKKEEQNRLMCEKVLNESWSKVEKYTEDIQIALKKKILTKKDLLLIKLAAYAFVQKISMEKADSIALFGVDLYNASPCGKNHKNDCPCKRVKCLFVE